MDDRFYVSQYGQDRVIDKLCYPSGDEPHRGIFLDIGSWDGMDISNTYMLEKKRDWRGLLVEPIRAKLKNPNITDGLLPGMDVFGIRIQLSLSCILTDIPKC
jgi:hypothetical protein